jgi:hypothetical protein
VKVGSFVRLCFEEAKIDMPIHCKSDILAPGKKLVKILRPFKAHLHRRRLLQKRNGDFLFLPCVTLAGLTRRTGFIYVIEFYGRNGTARSKKCKQLFEYQHLLLLRDIRWSKF